MIKCLIDELDSYKRDLKKDSTVNNYVLKPSPDILKLLNK
jgi:hypothetical protein